MWKAHIRSKPETVQCALTGNVRFVLWVGTKKVKIDELRFDPEECLDYSDDILRAG